MSKSILIKYRNEILKSTHKKQNKSYENFIEFKEYRASRGLFYSKLNNARDFYNIKENVILYAGELYIRYKVPYMTPVNEG